MRVLVTGSREWRDGAAITLALRRAGQDYERSVGFLVSGATPVLVHGDANGVTNIPHEIASEVANVCEEFAAAENVVIGYVRGGNVTPKGLGEARAEMSARVKALGERVRSRR